ncbi:Fe(3+)-hydroxamate ABC transporter permease FhuB [Paraburkholderia bannensis]|uniref:Fe(3+)-hydroxamate ABC transporter permease FhuB n=1 Tax=Paraburkholderia bannensis TaxID=765414 RepID=UPI000AA5A65F|nr:Fe(3+)-hydroxamate ABC transporter permease FhuB [Paraburkholderia bannensis]
MTRVSERRFEAPSPVLARHALNAAWLPFTLAVLTALLALHTLSAWLPAGQWFSASAHTDATFQLKRLVVWYAWLPRFAVSLLAGGALAYAGVLFQQVLRNPLAEPLTLGVAAGGNLALTAAAIWMPAWLAGMRFTVVLCGAVGAMLVTLALTRKKRFSPVAVILAGMVVNLYCGAVGVILTVAYERQLIAVFIWGGGSLSQNGWSSFLWLLPRVIGAVLAGALLVRPLTLLALGDEGASQLGLPLAWTRGAALGVAVLLSAFVVSSVGVIGFVGLAGPALVRLAGARTLRSQLLWGPLTGALLLALTDQLVQCLPGVAGDLLPTGAATALLGGPLLLFLLRKMPMDGALSVHSDPALIPRRDARYVAAVLCVALVAAVFVSLHLSQSVQGWTWSSGAQLSELIDWRWARMLASGAAGVMLALAGVLLQRTSGNPMASPELLGVSGGAMLGVMGVALFAAAPTTAQLLGASGAGALAALALMLLLGRKRGFAPGYLLLVGVAISGFSQSLIALATASGGAWSFLLRSVTMGSTYLMTPSIALTAACWTVLGCAAASLCARWLDILPLGGAVTDALGVNSRRARLAMLLLSALLTAGATVVIGPLSFVGLMAPHLARLLGFPRARAQMIVAALIGAFVMVAADWFGRNLIFPQQMPAGILAMLIGGPYLLWLLRR